MERKTIDWKKTGRNLKLLRQDNLLLRRYVCRTLRMKHGECDGEDCIRCRFEMDPNISQAELAEVFHVSESMLLNWENARSKPSLEDLLFYADICGLTLFDVVVFE
jgi:DNA-binding XRE family transcriptional regulator